MCTHVHHLLYDGPVTNRLHQPPGGTMSNYWKDFDFSKVEVKEFVPRTFSKEDHICVNKETVMKSGRIEYSKCLDCGIVVWS